MAMDIFGGWPLDGALHGNAKPKASEGIVAGMFVKKDANGELVKADGTAGEKAFFALENQSDYPVIEANKMAYIIANALVLTDQYDTGEVYGYDTNLMADSGNPGKVKPHGGGAQPVVGFSDGKVTRDGIEYLKIKLGEALH